MRSAISPASRPDRASKPQVKSGPDVFADALVPRAAPMAPGAPIFPGIQTPALPTPGLRPAEAFLRARAAARPSRTFDRHHALRFHGVRRLRRSGALRFAAWECDALRCANGYRSAKRQGKPNSANRCKPLRDKRSPHFAAAIARTAFTSRSSRCLNCSSILMGHDHPNKPANGERK